MFLRFLPTILRGAMSAILYAINTMWVSLSIILCALVGLLIPLKAWRQCWQSMGLRLIKQFTRFNTMILWLTTKTNLDIRTNGKLHNNNWSFIICNHQSWLDILILQRVFNKNLPSLRFFMKRELLWTLPLGGIACWFLGFPFLPRYRKSDLKTRKANKYGDIQAIQKACLACRNLPSTLVCFPEGTRYTKVKSKHQRSPYRHLLKPKSGGLALALQGLDQQLQYIVDVTIVYPRPISLWRYLCGQVRKIIVYYEVIEVNDALKSLASPDRETRRRLNQWLITHWQKKDQCIEDTNCNA